MSELLEQSRSDLQEDPYRLYAIVRGDLEMPSGKLASQAGHAYLNAYLKSLKERPEAALAYQSVADDTGTKVCLKAKNQDQLLRAYELCMAQGLPCSLIIDQHHIMPPHFTGEPIITALGIGPCRREEIHHITKRFSVCK